MKKLSRRQLLKSSLIAGSFAALPQPLLAATRMPLFIPPLIETKRGRPVFLNMQANEKTLVNGKSTEVWGFNGQYLGPTVKVKRGDFVKLNYSNRLPQFVAMHIQGVEASSELLGGVGHNIQEGKTWSPIIQISQPAATCWYHATTLANSAYQTYRGLFGMWLIEDEDSKQSALPKKYGVDDIPLMLQDMQFNAEGTPLFTQNKNYFFGNTLLVNGGISPYLDVPRALIRLRLLNASLSRNYELHFDDEREMTLIATDLGFVGKTKTITNLFLAPGERAEVIVDMSEGGDARLITGKKRNLLDKLSYVFNTDQQLSDNVVLELRTTGLSSAFNNKVQFNFNNHIEKVTKVAQERHIHLDTNNGTINQQRFNPHRIDINAKLGSVERWTLTATEATGFRIQGAKFIIESINDQAVVQESQGWKDTLWVNNKISILVHFSSMSSHTYPFIFGASDLMLADKGCFGLLVVQS